MSDDRLLVRARAIRGRLLAVWPDFPERVHEYERMARLLDMPWDDTTPLTHDDLDQIEGHVRALEAGRLTSA